MGKVTLSVAGRDYDIACRDGEEGHFRALAKIVDAKAADVARAMGGLTEARQLLFAALLLADEAETGAAPPPPDHSAAIAIERLAARAEMLCDRLEGTAPAS